MTRYCRVVGDEFPAWGWEGAAPVRSDQMPFIWSQDDAEYELSDSDEPEENDTNTDSPEPGVTAAVRQRGESVTAMDSRYGAGSAKDGIPRRNPPRKRRFSLRLQDAASVAREEPMTWEEAMAGLDRHHWEEALYRELQYLAENRTREIAALPRGRVPLTCKLVFKKTYNTDGTVASYKIRLECHGYKQRFGVDYDDTYAPVSYSETVLTIIASLVADGAHVHRADIATAFLYSNIDEEVYITLPHPLDDDQCYRLRKCLYGLRQSPRIWFELLTGTLQEYGFEKFDSAHCVYVKNKGTAFATTIIVYVDDLIIISKDFNEISTAKRSLQAKFKVKHLGEILHFLGIQSERIGNGCELFLSDEAI